MDSRSRFRLAGVGLGAAAAIWAAMQGDWLFAVVFGVASAFTAVVVLHELRKSQGR
jgi:predicted acetyltransferase